MTQPNQPDEKTTWMEEAAQFLEDKFKSFEERLDAKASNTPPPPPTNDPTNNPPPTPPTPPSDPNNKPISKYFGSRK